MNNKLTDLNNHLFMALERLNDEELSDDNLQFEIERSKAVTNVSKAIIDNARLVFTAYKHFDETGNIKENTPDLLKLTKNSISNNKEDNIIEK